MPSRFPTASRQLTSFLVPLTIVCVAAVGALAYQPAGANPQLPPWEYLEFEASKLFVTARSSITATLENSEEAQAKWFSEDFRGNNPADTTTLRLSTKTKMLGRSSVNTAWIDPGSMAAYQRSLTETGSRLRLKIYRFGPTEVLALRSSPATDTERALPEPQWTKRSEQRIAVPKNSTAVTDPVAIFFAIATRSLDELDRGYELTVLTSNRISKVRIQRTATVARTRTRSTVKRNDGSTVRENDETAIPTRLYAVTPLGDEGDLKILGLEGAIEVIVHEELRMPLEIRGRIPPVGKVAVKLIGARLR